VADAAAWGPTRIAYIDRARVPTSIWTALPDGSDRQKIAESPSDNAFAALAWSRDGRLVYSRGQAGAVVIVSDGTSHEVKLPIAEIDSLAWSPDGTRFLVTGRRRGDAVPDVYTVRTDGGDLTRATTDLDASGASWR
jgi:Tol biopolymer transport system component